MTAIAILFYMLSPLLGELPGIKNNAEKCREVILLCTLITVATVVYINLLNAQ